MSEPPSPDKRSFLRTTLFFLVGAVASALTLGTGRFLFFTSGKQQRREFSQEVLGRIELDEPFHVPEAGAWLVKRRGDAALSCLDDRCTHLGCRFSWNSERKLFECPCHGSEFDIEGNVKRGPASRPIQRLSTADPEDGKIRLIEKGSAGSG